MPQPLILMDAEVVLTSVDGERRMLVDDYIIATKKTALREDEIITKVIIPKQDFTHTFFRQDRYAPCERHLQADAFRRRHRS